MPKHQIIFNYYPGVFGDAFPGDQFKLTGSWDENGRYSDQWTSSDMSKYPSEDGGYKYVGVIELDDTQIGTEFHWGVQVIRNNSILWGIPAEVNSPSSNEQYRSFFLADNVRVQNYYLSTSRLLGANKYRKTDGTWGVKFRVWAPNALSIEVVFGTIYDLRDTRKTPLLPGTSILREHLAGGYIDENGVGIHPDIPVIPLKKSKDGIFESPDEHPSLQDTTLLNHCLYMFRITRDDRSVVYRTDLYSRCQCGFGMVDPRYEPYSGSLASLAGRVSCSVTVDPDKVVLPFSYHKWPEPEDQYIDSSQFWVTEFYDKKLPGKAEDLIIYELHLGSLGFGQPGYGTLSDAIAFLDHIEQLNVNAVELLPVSESAGSNENWGYATSHYFSLEYSGGGRDQFKHFIRECHRRGIAVILDVVYNHYDHHAERAQRFYDSPQPEKDIYFWYEGKTEDYRYLQNTPEWSGYFFRGGYIDNMSTGDAPAYHQEMVRKLFISSAVAFITEFHIDGFRVDQTTSIHQYNKLRADGREVSHANIFGAKFLREFGRTLRLFKPDIILIAEDHSDWDQITAPVEQGGMGFNARWYSGYYHNLIGDTNQGIAKLILSASRKHAASPLDMALFSSFLWQTKFDKVVYCESHDEAGNSEGPFPDPDWNGENGKQFTSHRTIVVAADNAPLVGSTRKYAEARCRFAYGITALSAGIPMIFFGEEVGAQNRFKYQDVLKNREDLFRLKETTGTFLYRFYADINAFRRNTPAIRSKNIDILHVHDQERTIAFTRWDDTQLFLIIASLSDFAFHYGYEFYHERLSDGEWQEVFNSDSGYYGGGNIGNLGEMVRSHQGNIKVVVPFAGFVIFQKIGTPAFNP
jgi:1,4-alpha-glucan branching enzyme